jgi:hypothetical protein
MALVWDQIGKMPRMAAWWDPHDPSEGGYSARTRRLRGRVSETHGVPGYSADLALRSIRDAHRTGRDRPSDFGFASGHEDSDSSSYPRELLEHHGWHDMEPEKVSLRQPIHASQWEMDTDSVAHNLFHPGKPHPADWDAVGNPDHDPSHDPMPVPTHVRTDLPRLYRNEQGQMHVVDGHHRLAADLLLRKPHTQALVWDAKNPPTKPKQLPLF